MLQLSLFQTLEPNWLDIDNDWLFEYLTRTFPHMQFKKLKEREWSCKGDTIQEIVSTTFKKVICTFYINEIDIKDFPWWENPVLVNIAVDSKIPNNIRGMSFNVNNMTDFIEKSEFIVNKCNEWEG